MARRQISSSFSVCQLGFLGGVFGCYCMAGMTKTYVSRSWYLICSRTKTLMTFVRVWASANACFPYSLFLSYLLVMFSSWSVFFCAAMMTRTYISRCWDLIVQGPKFDELCACLSQCTFIHCVSSMILICCPWCIHSELGLNFVLLVHVWWQFVYQMMLLDACFFCFLDSSNRSSCSRPIYRTVLDGVWHCKKKKSVMPKWMFESSEPELIVLIHFASLVLLSRHHGDKYYHRCSELSD